MNFHGQALGAILCRTTEQKLKSIEKQLADKVYPDGSAWHSLLIHLRDVYSKEIVTAGKGS